MKRAAYYLTTRGLYLSLKCVLEQGTLAKLMRFSLFEIPSDLNLTDRSAKEWGTFSVKTEFYSVIIWNVLYIFSGEVPRVCGYLEESCIAFWFRVECPTLLKLALPLNVEAAASRAALFVRTGFIPWNPGFVATVPAVLTGASIFLRFCPSWVTGLYIA